MNATAGDWIYSKWRLVTASLSLGHFVESPELEIILSRVESLNGHWERVFDGVLIMYLPKDADYDPSNEINNLIGDG